MRHGTTNQEQNQESRENEIIQMLERESLEISKQHVEINLTIENTTRVLALHFLKHLTYCMEVARNIMRHI